MLFIAGLVFMIMGYMENHKKCPPPRVEYRYIPRNFYEEQVTEQNLTNTYSDMFNKAETWNRYPVGIAGDDTDNTGNFIQDATTA